IAADGPDEAAGDEVEIAVVGDRRVVVAERGREDLRLPLVQVRPDADVVVGPRRLGAVLALGLERLLAAGEGVGRVLELADVVVVKLLVPGLPVGHSLGDRAVLVDERDLDRRLRAVAGRLEARELEPRRRLRESRAAEAV